MMFRKSNLTSGTDAGQPRERRVFLYLPLLAALVTLIIELFNHKAFTEGLSAFTKFASGGPLALLVDVLLCNVFIKNLVARTRPFDVNTTVQLLVAKPRDYSFPSGHTAASFASVTALYLAGEKKMWKAALVLAVLIALSRLYLYVHYPTDIIGGVIFGSLSGYLGYKIVEQIRKKR